MLTIFLAVAKIGTLTDRCFLQNKMFQVCLSTYQEDSELAGNPVRPIL